MITKENSLGNIVRKNFRTASIFESYGLDYCCSGSNSLEKACREKNINLDEIIVKLESVNVNKNGSGLFDSMELDELIGHIINVHHSYVNKMIPEISNHAIKVLNVHGENHPELEELNVLWRNLVDELENHLLKEEKMLFPYIKKLIETKKDSLAVPFAPFGSVGNPISVMEKEHLSAGNVFICMHEITSDFTLPVDACAIFKVLYDELKDFEKDLHIHIHLENNILYPKAIMLEYELTNKK